MPATIDVSPYVNSKFMERVDLQASAISLAYGDFLSFDTNSYASQALSLAGTSATTTAIAGFADFTKTTAYTAADKFTALKVDKDVTFEMPLVSATGTSIAWSQTLVGTSRPMYRASTGVYCCNGVTTTVNISCLKIVGVKESTISDTYPTVRVQILPSFLALGQ